MAWIDIERIALSCQRLSLSAILLAALSAAGAATARSADLDGVWQGTAEPKSCLGYSKVKFTVEGQTASGTWSTRGGSIFRTKTEKFTAIVDGMGRITASFGAGSFFLSIAGNLNDGSGGGMVMNPGQSLCMSVWQVRKIAGLPAATGADTEVAETPDVTAEPPAAAPAADAEAEKEGRFADIQTRLNQLKRLLEQDLITEQEAAEARRQLLDEL